MDKRTQKKKIIMEIFWFLLKFNILLIPFYTIIYFDINFYLVQEWFANFIGSILRMNYPVNVSGFFIYVGDLVIDISRDCLGWKSAYSLFALVLASPGKLKDKFKFLGVWVPVLLIINVFRVLGTILFGLTFGLQYLEIIHTFIWQEVMIAVLLIVWYLWLRKGNK